MSEQFKMYIHSPKHHISEQTIREFINSVNMIANKLFDDNDVIGRIIYNIYFGTFEGLL